MHSKDVDEMENHVVWSECSFIEDLGLHSLFAQICLSWNLWSLSYILKLIIKKLNMHVTFYLHL